MRRFAGWGVCPANLILSVCVFIAAAQSRTQAATLSLAGIPEGSQVTLPVSVLSTGLLVNATVAGIAGTPQVEFALEGKGMVIGRATSGSPYAVTFTNLSSGKYFLSARVASSPEVTSDVSFDIVPATLAPANDSWSQAAVIPSVGTLVTGANVYATRETDEPSPWPNAAGRSAWWSWQAGVSGLVTATTVGSGFDTVLAVYQGTNLATLTLVGANDDAGPGGNVFSQVSFNAHAGTIYHLAVDSAIALDGSDAGGEVRLRIVEASPPVVVIAPPGDGSGLVVSLPFATTNVSVVASINSPTGIERVEFSLDGESPDPMTGVIPPPFQWSLPNLPTGDYWLSVMAAGSNGLLGTAHVGFSVARLAPSVQLVDLPGISPAGLPMAVTGLKGTNYTLQSSSNLIAWSELKRWTNFPGAERVNDTNGLAGGARFYRATFP